MKCPLAQLPVFGVSYLVLPDQLPPSGHVELFNSRDFSGWSIFPKGESDPANTWSVTNAVIHCTGQPVGCVHSVSPYQDFVLTVEWRFLKASPKADNPGVLVLLQLPDQVCRHVFRFKINMVAREICSYWPARKARNTAE